jgi:hypothetical protein
LKDTETIELRHILGKRINTKWTQWKEPIQGTVVAHEGKGRFWVHYAELKDDEGTHYFLENLLCGRPPQWEYIEDDVAPKERDVV